MAVLMRTIAAATLAAGALAACGPSAEARAGVQASDAWIRTPPPGAATAGGYVVLTNTGGAPDRLIGAASPAAASVMVHESRQEGAMMRMVHLDALALPPGKAVALKPGGYHLMMVGLRGPLAEGAKAPVTLRFERAGEVQVLFQVRQGAAPQHHHAP